MIPIITKEFNSFLSSLIAYIVISAFLTAMGLLIWVFPDTSVLDYGFADMGTLFSLAPYIFIFLIPAITMRSFSEEKKTGTIEMLLTKPISDWSLVLGKFAACLLLVLFAILPTLLYGYSISKLGNPVGNIDIPGVAGSYIGLFLLASVFCSVGILSSSLTSNQIVAFILSAFLCFILYTGFESLASLPLFSGGSLVLKQIGILHHYESISKGLIDSRDLIYFTSSTFLMLLITKTVLASRTW